MEPIDHRITAATLLTLRNGPDPAAEIGRLLEVSKMDLVGSVETRDEIDAFIASGDATAATQLIHTASLRVRPTRPRFRS